MSSMTYVLGELLESAANDKWRSVGPVPSFDSTSTRETISTIPMCGETNEHGFEIHFSTFKYLYLPHIYRPRTSFWLPSIFSIHDDRAMVGSGVSHNFGTIHDVEVWRPLWDPNSSYSRVYLSLSGRSVPHLHAIPTPWSRFMRLFFGDTTVWMSFRAVRTHLNDSVDNVSVPFDFVTSRSRHPPFTTVIHTWYITLLIALTGDSPTSGFILVLQIVFPKPNGMWRILTYIHSHSIPISNMWYLSSAMFHFVQTFMYHETCCGL